MKVKMSDDYKKYYSDVFYIDESSIYIDNNENIMKIYKHKRNYNQREKVIKRLFKKQSEVKKSDFPQDIIYLDDDIIGVVVKKYSDAKHLYDLYTTESIFKIIKILKDLNNNIKELCDNQIYYVSLKTDDVLVDELVHIINFDNNRIDIMKKANEIRENKCYRMVYNIILSYIRFLLDTNDVTIFKDINKIYDVVNKELSFYNYDSVNDFLNMLTNNIVDDKKELSLTLLNKVKKY